MHATTKELAWGSLFQWPLVEMLGGKIKVKSEENEGSAFSFIIDYKPITD